MTAAHQPGNGLAFVLRISLACLVLFAAGCNTNLPGKPNPKDRPVPSNKVLAFDALFSQDCAGCHGTDGTMGAAPPLNDPLFRSIVSVAQLETVLEHGRKKTSMAPFAHSSGGPLTKAQVQVLVYEVKGVPYQIIHKPGDDEPRVELATDGKGIVPRWGMSAPAPAMCPPYALPETTGDAARGAQVFTQACAACHGSNGEGFMRDGKLRNKINDVSFLTLMSDQAIRRIIITGRSDLKMPNYAEKTERADDFQPLTSAEIADLGAVSEFMAQGKQQLKGN